MHNIPKWLLWVILALIAVTITYPYTQLFLGPTGKYVHNIIWPTVAEKRIPPIYVEPSVVNLAGGENAGIGRIIIYNRTENIYREIWVSLSYPNNLSPHNLLITIRTPKCFAGLINYNKMVRALFGHNIKGEKLIYLPLTYLGPKEHCIFDVKNMNLVDLKMNVRINKIATNQPQIVEHKKSKELEFKFIFKNGISGFSLEDSLDCPISEEEMKMN